MSSSDIIDGRSCAAELLRTMLNERIEELKASHLSNSLQTLTGGGRPSSMGYDLVPALRRCGSPPDSSQKQLMTAPAAAAGALIAAPSSSSKGHSSSSSSKPALLVPALPLARLPGLSNTLPPSPASNRVRPPRVEIAFGHRVEPAGTPRGSRSTNAASKPTSSILDSHQLLSQKGQGNKKAPRAASSAGSSRRSSAAGDRSSEAGAAERRRSYCASSNFSVSQADAARQRQQQSRPRSSSAGGCYHKGAKTPRASAAGHNNGGDSSSNSDSSKPAAADASANSGESTDTSIVSKLPLTLALAPGNSRIPKTPRTASSGEEENRLAAYSSRIPVTPRSRQAAHDSSNTSSANVPSNSNNSTVNSIMLAIENICGGTRVTHAQATPNSTVTVSISAAITSNGPDSDCQLHSISPRSLLQAAAAAFSRSQNVSYAETEPLRAAARSNGTCYSPRTGSSAAPAPDKAAAAAGGSTERSLVPHGRNMPDVQVEAHDAASDSLWGVVIGDTVASLPETAAAAAAPSCVVAPASSSGGGSTASFKTIQPGTSGGDSVCSYKTVETPCLGSSEAGSRDGSQGQIGARQQFVAAPAADPTTPGRGLTVQMPPGGLYQGLDEWVDCSSDFTLQPDEAAEHSSDQQDATGQQLQGQLATDTPFADANPEAAAAVAPAAAAGGAAGSGAGDNPSGYQEVLLTISPSSLPFLAAKALTQSPVRLVITPDAVWGASAAKVPSTPRKGAAAASAASQEPTGSEQVSKAAGRIGRLIPCFKSPVSSEGDKADSSSGNAQEAA